MNRAFVRKHIASVSIVLFLGILFIVSSIKPHFLFNRDGSLRDFGVGFKKKTIVPMWLTVMVIAIMSYYAVLYVLAVPKLGRLIL